jgi:hypothetical protein
MTSKKTKIPMDEESLNAKTLSSLKTLCKKLGVECSGKKSDHVKAILMSQDAGDEKELPLKEDDEGEELSFVIDVPTKKTTKKKSPAKKTTKKKSPAKKTAAKKSPAKKTAAKKTCVDKEDPLECEEGEICSAPSGRCVKDTKINRHGSKNDKVELLVDGRVIVGTSSTIKKLQQILGGEIKSSVKKTVTKKSPVKKTVTKKSPVKKTVTKKSPVKKTVTKKSPVKKTVTKKSPVKKSPVKKTVTKKSPVKKTCVDKEDPLECEEGEICSAPSGRCIKDTKINRHGSKNDKVELLVDGRVIVGTSSTIKKLQQLLGGEIKSPAKKSPAKKTVKKSPSPSKKSPVKKSPVKKSPVKKSPVKKSPVKKSPVKKSPVEKKRTSPKGKEELSPAKPTRTSKKKSGSPHTLAEVEKRLNKLVQESGDHSEIENLKEKLAKLKAGGKSPREKLKSGKVQMKEQEIYKTFMNCLSSLSSE